MLETLEYEEAPGVNAAWGPARETLKASDDRPRRDGTLQRPVDAQSALRIFAERAPATTDPRSSSGPRVFFLRANLVVAHPADDVVAEDVVAVLVVVAGEGRRPAGWWFLEGRVRELGVF